MKQQCQYNRINRKNYHLKVTMMISAVSSATSNGKFIIHLLERRKSDMANHREILSRMVFSDVQRPNRNPRVPDQRMTFKALGKWIGKDPTTILKKVKLHGQTYTNNFTKTKESCSKLIKVSFVCNGCPKRTHSSCLYPHSSYQAQVAQKKQKVVLVESGEGIPLAQEELYRTEQGGTFIEPR